MRKSRNNINDMSTAFLSDDVKPRLAAAIDAGMRAMKATLDTLTP